MTTLKRIDAISVPAVENSLALFDLPPSVVSYNKTFVKELLPLNTLTREGPYHFRLYSDSSFCDLSRTYIQLILSLEKKSDGDWIPISDTNDDKNTALIQNFGLSFIRQLKIAINSIEVYNSTELYPFLAYINREFFNTFGSNMGLREATGYSTDRSGDSSEQNNPKGGGFTIRKQMVESGKKCVTLTRLEFDLASQPRLLLSNTDILFSIWASSDKFLVLSPQYPAPLAPAQANEGAEERAARIAAEGQATPNSTDYRIKVHDVRLYCTLVDVVQSLQNSIAKQLESTPAKYPIRRLEMRKLFMPEGMTNLSFNCFQTVLPRRVLVFFVETAAFDGSTEKSPFEFKHANVQTISIESGGLYIPSTPYMLDYGATNENFYRAYWDFHKLLGMDEGNEGLDLTPKEYKTGWCGYGFDLRSFNRELGDAFELIKNSNTVLKAHLSTPVGEGGLMLLVWGEFDSVITINNDRVISLDGSI